MIDESSMIKALERSTLIDELRDFEVRLLLEVLTKQRYGAGEFIAKHGDCPMRDALLILVDGCIEVSALVEGQPVILELKESGAIARVASFVGNPLSKIDAVIEVKTPSAVLLLDRAKLEGLLGKYPSIVYYVMRSLVRHVHSLARHKSAEVDELNSYFFGVPKVSSSPTAHP